MKKKINTNIIKWITSILNKRISYELELNLDSNNWIINIVHSKKKIKIPLNYIFYNSFFNDKFPYSDYKFEIDFLKNYEYLPAPGYDRCCKPLLLKESDYFLINFDILGLLYWMLTRSEEIYTPDNLLDCFDRFPAKKSHGYKHNYLHRPLVDEWLFIFQKISQDLWPKIKINSKNYKLILTHDVDIPSRFGFRSKTNLLKSMISHSIKTLDLFTSINAYKIYSKTPKVLEPNDPFNKFDYLMDTAESMGIKSTFYFITGRSDIEKDALYNINDEAILGLIKKIIKRGHHIGLHPSFNSYNKPEIIKQEYQKLKKNLSYLGFNNCVSSSRMHYLRWKSPNTALNLSKAGINYDSSLGFADYPGFRCGTCHEYQMFDPIKNRSLDIVQRPLILMDTTIINSSYLGKISIENKLEIIKNLKNECKEVNGNFTLLWHNNNLVKNKNRRFFEKVLEL